MPRLCGPRPPGQVRILPATNQAASDLTFSHHLFSVELLSTSAPVLSNQALIPSQGGGRRWLSMAWVHHFPSPFQGFLSAKPSSCPKFLASSELPLHTHPSPPLARLPAGNSELRMAPHQQAESPQTVHWLKHTPSTGRAHVARISSWVDRARPHLAGTPYPCIEEH